MTARAEVMIVGAGPSGLVLALWLARLGHRPRIIDRAAAPGTTSRALAVQARTLELYRQLDLADAVVERGHKVPAVNLWVRGQHAARVPFETVGANLTPYAFLEIFPQDQHERLLIERLGNFGVAVERNIELTGFTDMGDHVVARLRRADGSEETAEAAWIAGCDGARSVVRETIGAGFPGGTYRQVFYVADIEGDGPAIDGELHIDLDEADFLAVFPLAGTGRARLVGAVRDERADRAETLGFDDVGRRAIDHLKLRIETVNWFSTYRLHHRVTDRFRQGRALLVGDAAHIHSPAGGQGMNTGIGDAINLAWKLATVLEGRAPETLLDSYQAERIGFARRLVATTDRLFSFASAEGRIADLLRTRVAPLLIPHALGFGPIREYMFRALSQIAVNYRDAPLSRGAAGRIRGGDRLPWAHDNFDPLKTIGWQVHVYGAATPALAAWCETHGVPLHAYPWRPDHEAAGLARDALYLIRPDTYVALADPAATLTALDRYFADHKLRL